MSRRNFDETEVQVLLGNSQTSDEDYNPKAKSANLWGRTLIIGILFMAISMGKLPL